MTREGGFEGPIGGHSNIGVPCVVDSTRRLLDQQAWHGAVWRGRGRGEAVGECRQRESGLEDPIRVPTLE